MGVHEIYQIAELISSCIRGEILPVEKQQILDQWIKASEENKELFDRFPALPIYRAEENS